MSFEPVWGAPIAWYLFLAGLGGGAFITSAFLRWKHPEAHGMRFAGHIIAPVVVIIGLFLLMFDAEAGLHNPLRFALLLHNPCSVMTWGVVFLAAFVIIALITLLLDCLKKQVPVWLEIAGSVFAVCVGAYTGALLGVCQTFPLWNNALLPILFLVSAMSTGAASVLLIGIGCDLVLVSGVSTGMSSVLLVGGLKFPKEFDSVGVLKKFHYCFPIIELVLVASLCFITSYNSVAGFESVMSLVCGNWAVLFWLGFIVVGLVAPTAVETWLLFISKPGFEETPKAHYIGAAADAGVLIGGFLLRFLIVVAALPVALV